MSSLPVLPSQPQPPGRRLPPWLKRPLPTAGMAFTRRVVGESHVATVCEEARCPNLTECWSHKTATFMILGDRCTRRCKFCAVETARPEPPAADEPQRLADAVAELGLRHVVITAVARDDLEDEGAGQFAACVRAVRARKGVRSDLPERPDGCFAQIGPDPFSPTIEVLPADFHARRECISTLCEAGPDVYNHNIETVERLSPVVRPQAKYRRSLEVLRVAKELRPDIPTKSGVMVGIGETIDEVLRTLADLRAVDCDVVTIGQYLAPSSSHAPVARYYPPEEFEMLAEAARSLGFLGVASGPFVRSSYNAGDVYERYRRMRATPK